MDYMFAKNEEECINSSGCESGWTLYLEEEEEHYSYSTSPYISSSCNKNNVTNNYMRNEGANNCTQSAKRFKQQDDDNEEEEEEEEDMSMVSDASSGPPHLHEQEEEGYDVINGSFYQYAAPVDIDPFMSTRKKSRDINIINRRRKPQDNNTLLDDTASSPFFDFSDKSLSTTTRSKASAENVLEYSQGYSSTQILEVRPPYQEHYDFFQSSQPPNLLHQNQWFEGKMW